MRSLPLHWRILIGLALGVVVGLIVNRFGDSFARAGESVPALGAVFTFLVGLTELIGGLFLRALRFIAIPIVLFSLIVGAASLGGKGGLGSLGRIGGKTIGLYLATTAVAVTMGLVIAGVVRPGAFVGEETRAELIAQRAAEVEQRKVQTQTLPSVWQQIVDVIPANPFAALAQAQMIQVIVFALVIGVGLGLIAREKSAPVVAFFDTMTDVMIKLVHAIMWTAPVAVFALVAPVVATMGLGVIKALGVYFLSVCAGMGVLLLLVYPLLLITLARYKPSRYFKGMAPAQLLALSTSSSAATLPVTMSCVKERLGVSERITSFVCPLGATINMDATALMQAVATVFTAQMFGIELTFSQQATVVLLATLASIGSPGIPSGGIVMLVIVLESVGLPIEGVAVVLAVDRLLDMLRTVVNVSGDGMVAVVVGTGEGEVATAEEVERRLREADADDHPLKAEGPGGEKKEVVVGAGVNGEGGGKGSITSSK